MSRPTSRRIVVGVDASRSSRRALHRAAEDACAHDAVLEVLMAWSFLDQVTGAPFDRLHGEASVRAELEQMVKEVLADGPQPAVAVPGADRARRGRRADTMSRLAAVNGTFGPGAVTPVSVPSRSWFGWSGPQPEGAHSDRRR